LICSIRPKASSCHIPASTIAHGRERKKEFLV
jgi:hypothetical protein